MVTLGFVGPRGFERMKDMSTSLIVTHEFADFCRLPHRGFGDVFLLAYIMKDFSFWKWDIHVSIISRSFRYASDPLWNFLGILTPRLYLLELDLP